MANLAAQTIGITGVAPTFAAVTAGGDTAPVGDRLWLEFRNSNAATRDITLAVPGNTTYGVAAPDKTYTIAALTGELRVPLLGLYKDPTTKRAMITYTASGVGVTVAVVRI